MNDEAILSSSGDFTCFAYGGRKIRFRTSPYLERYVDVKKWDSSIGYIVVTARYHDEDVEDYIGLLEILENLYVDAESFLKPIKKVRIFYD